MTLKKLSEWLNKTVTNEDEKKMNEEKDWNKTTFTFSSKTKKLEVQKKDLKKDPQNKQSWTIQKKPLNKKPNKKASWPKLRIIPIWWFEEVWKNSMVLEFWDDIILIDAWLQFAEAEMLWVDYVIPDISYLEKNKKKIRWIVITHGHLDHIWALPHILPKLDYPKIYATKLTNWLSKRICDDRWVWSRCKFIDINPQEVLKLWIFEILPFRVNHSIPDWVWLRVKTPNWSIVHTWDFKFDFSPSDWTPSDYWWIAKIWDEWVVAAFVDSTNSWKEWFAKSEKVVAESLEQIIKNADWRIIMALFASLIWRISEIVKFAEKYDRKIFLSWRSLVNNIEIAQRLGYIKDPKWLINKLSDHANKIDPKKCLILCTGSQWEDLAALARISRWDHALISLKKSDTVVLSSSPIIWNERSVYTLIDQITEQWAHIVTNSAMDVHTSGHAYQGELMLMYSLLKPKYLVPIHWELFMRVKHRDVINERLWHPRDQMPILYNGSILEIDKNWNAEIAEEKLDYKIVMVDWLWVWDIGTAVLRERQVMSENWVIVVLYQVDKKTKKLIWKPEVMSKWFITIKESPELNKEVKQRAEKLYNDAIEVNENIELKPLKKIISDWMIRYTDKKIKRIPLVVPVLSYV